MGCVASCKNGNDGHIKSFMKTAEKEDDKVIKMLLLGPGSTGKSTLFKSLRMVHKSGHLSMEYKMKEKQLILMNILASTQILITQSEMLYIKDPILYKDCHLVIDPNIEAAINSVASQQKATLVYDACDDDEKLRVLGESIDLIWNLECIRATYSHRFNNFAISDNLEHFCNSSKLAAIFKQDYIPNEDDCLKNRSKTSGMQEYAYAPPKLPNAKSFKLVDVGGQRTERRKWIHHFDKYVGFGFIFFVFVFVFVLFCFV